MGIAVHTPHTALYFRVEHKPVGSVHPFAGNSACGTSPGGATIFAPEQADIGICDEHTLRIKRIEVDAVSCGHVQADSCPPRGIDLARIEASPRCTAVDRAHGPSQIGADA